MIKSPQVGGQGYDPIGKSVDNLLGLGHIADPIQKGILGLTNGVAGIVGQPVGGLIAGGIGILEKVAPVFGTGVAPPADWVAPGAPAKSAHEHANAPKPKDGESHTAKWKMH